MTQRRRWNAASWRDERSMACLVQHVETFSRHSLFGPEAAKFWDRVQHRWAARAKRLSQDPDHSRKLWRSRPWRLGWPSCCAFLDGHSSFGIDWTLCTARPGRAALTRVSAHRTICRGRIAPLRLRQKIASDDIGDLAAYVRGLARRGLHSRKVCPVVLRKDAKTDILTLASLYRGFIRKTPCGRGGYQQLHNQFRLLCRTTLPIYGADRPCG